MATEWKENNIANRNQPPSSSVTGLPPVTSDNVHSSNYYIRHKSTRKLLTLYNGTRNIIAKIQLGYDGGICMTVYAY